MNFKPLEEFLDGLYEKQGIPACDCMVFKGHQQVFRHMTGYSDANRTIPLSENYRYILYSATKVITCTCAMQLIERGQMKLTDEICKYLPEYTDMYLLDGSKAQNKITVEHLLSMRGGFNYITRPDSVLKLLETKPNATTAEVIREYAKTPLQFEPGTHFRYSMCHDVLGRVIEVVSGMTLYEYMSKNIFEPLSMTDISFSIGNPETIVEQYKFNANTWQMEPMEKDCQFQICPGYESGGAGLIGTANDYGKFVEAMCNYGEASNGYRVLKKETIDIMRTNILDKQCLEDFLHYSKPGYGYGMGVRTLTTKKFGSGSPVGEFGWDGAAGAYVLLDVENNIGIFYAQHVRGLDCANIIHKRLRDITYEILNG